MKKFGFTLAEVLLAVAILGVVAAVTIGVLRNVIPEDYRSAEECNSRGLYIYSEESIGNP